MRAEDGTGPGPSPVSDRRRALIREFEPLRSWIERWIESAKRVDGLTKHARKVRDRHLAADILRSAVVLQHAYLEAFLRTATREKRNYNHIGDVKKALRRLGCRVEEHDKWLPGLSSMIERRHDIVHRADRVEGAGDNVLQPISASQVKKWVDTADGFMTGLWPICVKRSENSKDVDSAGLA